MAAAKKILTAAIVGVVLLVGSLVAMWGVFVSAPPPGQICDHIIDVTVAEAGQQGMDTSTQSQLIERLREQCVQHKNDKLKLRGRIIYARYARCIMDSTTLRAIEDC